MAKFLATIKAIFTRAVFGMHSFVAIWQVSFFKGNDMYWYLATPLILLFFEGIFTLTIKKHQEWKWFCPSVFLYLTSVVPAIWLLELDKVEKRLRFRDEQHNVSNNVISFHDLKELHKIIGTQVKLPDINLNTDTWITLIEQFLMLILIIGRWLLPKGDLTRDQLSQLLLVYIGTAADIIEFFDSFKDETIASEPLLVILTLSIWSWSLLQFTVVLTATKARKSRLSSTTTIKKNSENYCCNIDVWAIALNIVLQDAPFLTFRLLIIVHYNIISYMNVFFACKNTLVILLQLYRLYVIYSENRKNRQINHKKQLELVPISIISKSNKRKRASNKHRPVKRITRNKIEKIDKTRQICNKRLKTGKKDLGYSTGSSHTSYTQTPIDFNEFPLKMTSTMHQIEPVFSEENSEDSFTVSITDSENENIGKISEKILVSSTSSVD